MSAQASQNTDPKQAQACLISNPFYNTRGGAVDPFQTVILTGDMGCCNSKQFEGQGQRLGSANEPPPTSSRPTQKKATSEIPQPVRDPNITDSDRDRIRAERAAAAEARAKAQQIGGKKKKKTPTTDEPLRGPNSRNTMNWTMG